MIFAEGNHVAEKTVNVSVFLQEVPVQPGNGIVLAIGVVIPELGIAEFVSGQKHRGSTAAQEDGTGIFDQTVAELVDRGIVGFPFNATVPAAVIVSAVGIVPAIGFIVFGAVGIQIIQRKTIVAGDEIYGRIVTSPIRFIQIRRTCYAQDCFRCGPQVAF